MGPRKTMAFDERVASSRRIDKGPALSLLKYSKIPIANSNFCSCLAIMQIAQRNNAY